MGASGIRVRAERLIWLWCAYAKVSGHLNGQLKAIRFDGLPGNDGSDASDRFCSMLGKHEASRVFANIQWTSQESATLRTALKVKAGDIERVVWNESVMYSIALKLAEAIETSGYSQEQLEALIWQNT